MKKKIETITLTLTMMLATVAPFACGGHDECETLADICAKCTDASVRSACTSIANADAHEACETAVKAYEGTCK